MMKATLLALLVALLMVGCGEPDLSDPDVVKDTTADAVDCDDLENRNWVTYLLNEETPFTGRAERFYENGQKQSKRDYKDGKLVTSVAWKPNGEKCPVTNVKDGNGVEVTYYENGQKESETNYKDGKRDGLATSWDENGQKEREGNWKEDVEDGLFSWYEDDGEKRLEKIYKDGKEDGLWTSWYENGQKQQEVNYKHGKPDGLSTTWYENGQKQKEGNWKDGKRMSAKVWKPNGEKCPVTSLKDGNGVLVWYNDDGTEMSRTTYKDGERVRN